MKLKITIGSWLGILLFVAGMLLGLSHSASITWGQAESFLYTSFTADSRFGVRCPLMLSPDESGVLHAKIANFTDENILPVVFVEISHSGAPRRVDQTVSLASHEAKVIQWTVNPSDVVYGRLILVNVLQARYRDNPSFLGSCGILLFSLFGLTGFETFTLLTFVSPAGMVGGGVLWWKARQPLDTFSASFARINAVLMGITILAMLSTFPHWWGLTLFLDALTLLVFGVIITDFVLFPKKDRS